MLVARALVLLAEAYLGAGLIFAVAFVSAGVGAIDHGARGASVGFRLLILPGCALLWPILALRWLRRAPPPEERNAHRRLATGGPR